MLHALEYLQSRDTLEYYDGILSRMLRAILEDVDYFGDSDDLIDLIRGFHQLRRDLRLLVPECREAEGDPTGLSAVAGEPEEG